MFLYLTSLFLLALALGLLAWIARRAVRARRVPSIDAEVARIKRELAVLKVLHADGKVTDYEHRRRALAVRLVELGRAKGSGKATKPTSTMLGATAAACATLGIGALVWQLQTPSDVAADAPGSTAVLPLSADRLEHAAAQARQRVAGNPQDAGAWAMLAHSYDMLGRPADASAAYARLIELRPGDAQVLADAADSMALARGRNFDGEPIRLIRRALELDPDNLKALSLAGAEAFGRNDAAQAIAHWEHARTLVHDASLRHQLDGRITEAIAMKERSATAGAASPPARVASGAAPSVKGRIVLADRLKAKVSANDALFVFARPADGSRMPVALMRRRAGELPIEFELDDSMAMVPEARLSQQGRVVVGARISKRGDATPAAGDLQGFSVPVTIGSQGLRIEISEVVQ